MDATCYENIVTRAALKAGTLLAALLCATDGARAEEPAPPRGLVCLARHYGGRPTRDPRDGRWTLVLDGPGGGVALAWDRGDATRPVAARLEDPDLRDMLLLPYRPGPLRPITDPDEDPGRARVEALFAAAYPKGQLDRVTLGGAAITVHHKIAPALARVDARLATLLRADRTLRRFFVKLGGGYNDRAIAGTSRKSAHAFGIAVDVNPAFAEYWRWQPGGWRNRVPKAIVDAFEAEGFAWGGRWYHFDTMHFEYRPELFDPSCTPDS
jgi:hypothetical protein